MGIFAQVARTWTLGEVVIAIIVVAAVVAILYVALQAMGLQLPQWFVRILLIIAVAVVAVLAIRFLFSI